ncbi:hypothetical protein RJO69_002742 [Stenotrophomonas maltophilia]|nr:hypothetical protein [Stenotrophomonas maltophilia]
MEWDDNTPEPVIRGVRQAVGLHWRKSARCQSVSSLAWAPASVAATDRSLAWGTAAGVHQGNGFAWSSSSGLSASGQFDWHRTMRGSHNESRLHWKALGQASRSLEARWRSLLSALSNGSMLAWGSLSSSTVGLALRWRAVAQSASANASLQWRYPGSFRRESVMPWGAAPRIPWGVRPGPGPDPEPEPGPGFPPGNQVGLNLGCGVLGLSSVAPLNLGISACYVVRPQRRTYVVINEVSFVRLPDRVPIELARVSLSAGRSAWGWTFDIELADADQLGLLKPTALGPRQFELMLNGYVWTGIIESFQKQREFAGGGVRLSGRSRTALLAPPYAPARVKATTEERSMAQLVAEELADTGFASDYQTVDWSVPPGAWFYDASTPLDAISTLASASGGVVQSHPSDLALVVRASYPASPWLWRETTPNHVLQEDIVLTESLQMRSAPLYDAVVVTGELAGKGVTCKVRKGGEAGQLFAQQVSSPLINVAAAAAERGRNILCDRGEQAAVDLTVPLFPRPLKAGEIGVILPLDLVQVLSSEGTWHGQCESIRIEVVVDQQAVVIEQTATLERHFTDAD